jgi:hypothetical protein
VQAAPLLLEILGACKQTWYRKVGMSPSRVVSRAPKAPVPQKSLGMLIPILRLECSHSVNKMLDIGICSLAHTSE